MASSNDIPADSLSLILARNLQVPRLMRMLRGRGLTIVSYHGVVADADWRDWETADMIADSVFREHLAFYSRHYQVVALRRAIASLWSSDGEMPARALAITFDDGYRNNLFYALPALKECGLTATFFITTGFLDKTSDLWWLPIKKLVVLCEKQNKAVELPGLGTWPADSRERAGRSYQEILVALKALAAERRAAVVETARKRLEGAPDPLGDITWNELRELGGQGMEVGAHTVNHPILARESDQRIRQEIDGSVKQVKSELQLQGPLAFAYPDGQREDCQVRIESMVSQAGCYAGLANFAGINRRQTNRYRLQRFPIGGHHTRVRLELDLCGLRSLKTRMSTILKNPTSLLTGSGSVQDSATS
jgi:peptidoglycan/xylan/chitin deacetylase (PgdA/CDA1 family)